MWVLQIEFGCGEHSVSYFPGDDLLGLGHEGLQVVEVDIFTHDDHVEVGAVDATGQVADEVYFFGVAEVGDDAIDDFVHSHIFTHQPVDVAIKRVPGVGFEHFFHAIGAAGEQTGFFEAVELGTDGVGTFAKFGSQSTQVAGAGGVQEELQHELDAGLGCDEGFDHLVTVLGFNPVT